MRKEVKDIHDHLVDVVERTNKIAESIEAVDTATMSADKVHSLLAAGNEIHEAGVMLNRARVRIASIT